MADRLAVGTDQAVLAVTEVVFEAEGSDKVLSARQVRSGHGREQVVLDLVVESTEEEVGE